MTKFLHISILVTIVFGCLNCSTKKNIKKGEMITVEEKVEQESLSQVESNMPYFPAEIKQGENFYAVQITSDVSAFYAKEFRKNSLYGNGYCWEGILEQLITKERKSLLTSLNFDAEADTCFVSCKDEKSMKELAEFIHHHLSDKKKFNEVIQKIDKSKLDC